MKTKSVKEYLQGIKLPLSDKDYQKLHQLEEENPRSLLDCPTEVEDAYSNLVNKYFYLHYPNTGIEETWWTPPIHPEKDE